MEPLFTLTTWHELFHVTLMVLALAAWLNLPTFVTLKLKLPLPSNVTEPYSPCQVVWDPFAVKVMVGLVGQAKVLDHMSFWVLPFCNEYFPFKFALE